MVRPCRTCAGRPRPASVRPGVAPDVRTATAWRPVVLISLPAAQVEFRPAVLGLYEQLGFAVHGIGRAAYLHDDRTGRRFLVQWEAPSRRSAGG